jgi:hypothetical protein
MLEQSSLETPPTTSVCKIVGEKKPSYTAGDIAN